MITVDLKMEDAMGKLDPLFEGSQSSCGFVLCLCS